MKKNWLEWTVFVVGLAVIGSVIGALVYDGVRHSGQSPMLQVDAGPAQYRDGHYAVPLTVSNLGDATAEEVQVEAELTPHDGEKETATITILFVPRRSSREAWATFIHNPATAKEFTARAVGYKQP